MASITAVVISVKNDKRERIMARVQDADTRQYFTIYPLKDGDVTLSKKMENKTFIFKGTLHVIPNREDPSDSGIKLIAKSVASA